MKSVHKYIFSVLGILFALTTGTPLAAQTAAAKHPTTKTAAPKAAAKPKIPAEPTIIWRGDRATERAFMADLVREYEAKKLGKVTLQPFSTISGIDAVHDGTADIAGSARAAVPGRAEESDLTFYPIAWEALVPITSPKNPVDNVTLKQLYDIYLGRLTSWKDLGGGDEPINLYGVAASQDGVEYSVRKLLYHKGDQAVSVPRLYLNTSRLEEGVMIDPHALGFTTDSAVYSNRGIKVLKIEGRSATTTTIADGSYPLFSALYLAARSDGKNQAAVDKFIAFAMSDEGKAILRRRQLIPYADAPTLLTKLDEQIAYIDAQTGSTQPRPVSAPQATADFLQRTQPNSIEAQEAKARAAADRAAKEKTAGH